MEAKEPVGATCPTCRLFCDVVHPDFQAHVRIRCPWCGALSTVGQWVACADVDKCEACKHPKAMHARYGTNDGKPPTPTGGTQHVTVEAAPCARCKCTATSGAAMVRLS